jgi:hypothetical protein
LFEAVGARKLIDDGRVAAMDVRGLGVRVPAGGSTIEGDLVVRIADGGGFSGSRFIDFKAKNPGLDTAEGISQLRRIEDALVLGTIRQWVFAREAGTSLPPASSDWGKELAAINGRLLEADLEPIVADWVAGTF